MVVEQRIICTRNKEVADTDWWGCDIVIEASGKFKTKAALQAYLDEGAKRVVVTAPVKEDGVLDVVMGVKDTFYDPAANRIVSAVSCTINCLAPVVKVIHESLGIKHGCMKTIHDITNTQTILDAPHKDPRHQLFICAQVVYVLRSGSVICGGIACLPERCAGLELASVLGFRYIDNINANHFHLRKLTLSGGLTLCGKSSLLRCLRLVCHCHCHCRWLLPSLYNGFFN